MPPEWRRWRCLSPGTWHNNDSLSRLQARHPGDTGSRTLVWRSGPSYPNPAEAPRPLPQLRCEVDSTSRPPWCIRLREVCGKSQHKFVLFVVAPELPTNRVSFRNHKKFRALHKQHKLSERSGCAQVSFRKGHPTFRRILGPQICASENTNILAGFCLSFRNDTKNRPTICVLSKRTNFA